jgi:segregation and condensation protein A
VSTGFQPTLDFEAANEAAEDGAALVIDIDGYEGPLHVLLALARSQKVDLLQLSITKLAEQYLAFVQQARRVRFSLAADYLVMAAWLAYLKSRLLLPKPERPKAEEPPAEEMAAQLAFRLAKLDVMRKAVEALKDQPILKRDVFMRGDPEAVKIVSSTRLRGRPLRPDDRLHHPAQSASTAATTPRVRPRPIRWKTPATACATCCRR